MKYIASVYLMAGLPVRVSYDIGSVNSLLPLMSVSLSVLSACL